MRVVILSWRGAIHPKSGGAERLVDAQAASLADRGHEVTVFTSAEASANAGQPRTRYRTVRVGNWVTVYAHAARYLSNNRGSGGFDVVLEHIAGIPWYSRFYTGLPTVAYVYHLIGRTFFEELPFPLSLAGYLSERTLPKFYSDVSFGCLGPSAREQYIGLGIPAANIQLIPPGVRSAAVQPGIEKTETPSFMALGPLKQYKRHDVIVRAFAKIVTDYPGAELWITGWERGSLYSYLEGLARTLGVSRQVRLLGFVTEDEKNRLMARAWSMIYASEREGWGLGVLEAAAVGTPAIVAEVGGLKDAVVSGVTGLMFPVGETDALASRMKTIASSPEHREALGRAARTRASSYSWDHHVDLVEQLLRSASGA